MGRRRRDGWGKPLVMPTTMLTADCCVRCGQVFEDHEPLVLVSGNASAKYRRVALEVHRACVSSDFDQLNGVGMYRRLEFSPRGGLWGPPLLAGQPLTGYLRINWLEDGTWRVAQHRGHAEEYSAAERVDPTYLIRGAYSADGQMYAAEPLGSDWRRVIRVEFLDLSKPSQAMGPAPTPVKTTEEPMNGSPTRRERKVRLYKDGDQMGIRTTATEPEEFWREFSAVLAVLIDRGAYVGDWEFQLQRWLQDAFEIAAKLKGYKADVFEERVIYSGATFAGREIEVDVDLDAVPAGVPA